MKHSNQMELRTVQGELEKIARPFFNQFVKFFPSGRTDAGVSARNQVVLMLAMTETNRRHNRLDNKPVKLMLDDELLSVEEVEKRFSKILPKDIRLLGFKVASFDFSPMDNKWKRYIYTIDAEHMDVKELHRFNDDCARLNEFHVKQDVTPDVLEFDTEKMKEAAKLLIGTLDFESFQSKRGGKTDCVRTLFDCKVVVSGDKIELVFVGSGFLMHMCRILTGTLQFVGKGYLLPEDITRILEAKDRQMAGPKAWACGLTLDHVEYDSEYSLQ